jgi:hypothetical protein
LRSSAPSPPQPLNRPICSSQAGLSGGLAFFGHSLLAPTHQWIIAVTGLACAIYSIPGQRITPAAAPSMRLTLCPYLQVTYLRLEYMRKLQLTWVRRLPPCKETQSYPQSPRKGWQRRKRGIGSRLSDYNTRHDRGGISGHTDHSLQVEVRLLRPPHRPRRHVERKRGVDLAARGAREATEALLPSSIPYRGHPLAVALVSAHAA